MLEKIWRFLARDIPQIPADRDVAVQIEHHSKETPAGNLPRAMRIQGLKAALDVTLTAHIDAAR